MDTIQGCRIRRPENAEPQPRASLVETPLAWLLENFAALHPVTPAWQRDLASLLSRSEMRGLALEENGEIAAYVLLAGPPSETQRIIDFGARSASQATRLLESLKAQAERLTTINEPDDSLVTSAFIAAGFTEMDRQHEMVTEFT